MKYKKIRKLIKKLDIGKHQCYEEHKTKDGKCYGLSGGDASTCYLNDVCVGCNYLTILRKDERDEKNSRI